MSQYVDTLSALVTVLVGLGVIFGRPVRNAWRWLHWLVAAVSDLLELHNYPNRPPAGHHWPQRWRRERESERVRAINGQ